MVEQLAPVTASPAPVATVSTPVVVPSTVSPQPNPATPKPGQTNTIAKSYGTDGAKARGGGQGRNAAAATAAAAATREPPVSPLAPAPLPGEAPQNGVHHANGVAGTNGIAAATTEDADAPAVPVAVEAPPPKPAEMTDRDYHKRLAAIARAEGRTVEEKRQLALERKAFADERGSHKADLERIADMNNAKELARKDLPGFIHRVFGIKPSEVIDQYIRAGQKKPEEVATEAASATDRRIADLEAKLQEASKKEAEQATRRQVQDYMSAHIAPIVTDKARFPLLNEEFGADAPAQVYNIVATRFNQTGRAPQPLEVAQFVESQLRAKAERAAQLLGFSAGTPQTAKPKTVETPTATRQPVSAQQQQRAPVVATRRPRLTGERPYTSRPR
jgi:hypothetical protein